MSNEHAEEYDCDQPWNPVSYFEEENEATGGGGGDDSPIYSPTKLVSLFETNIIPIDNNILAVEQDLNIAKQIVFPTQSTSFALSRSNEKKDDIDDLSQYTLETDTSGIKVLDTTYEINRKALFHDFDRLRRWQETNNTQEDKDLFIREGNSEENINYLISPDGRKISMENILPNIPSDSQRLQDLDDRLSESEHVVPNDYSNSDISINSTQIHLSSRDVGNIQNILDLHSIENDCLKDKNEELNFLSKDTDSQGEDIQSQNTEIQINTNNETELIDCTTTNDNSLLLDMDTENAITSTETQQVDLLVDIAEKIVSSAESTTSSKCNNETSSTDENSHLLEESCVPGDIENSQKPAAHLTDSNIRMSVIGFGDTNIEINDEELDYLLDNLEDDIDIKQSAVVNTINNTTSVLHTASKTLDLVENKTVPPCNISDESISNLQQVNLDKNKTIYAVDSIEAFTVTQTDTQLQPASNQIADKPVECEISTSIATQVALIENSDTIPLSSTNIQKEDSKHINGDVKDISCIDNVALQTVLKKDESLISVVDSPNELNKLACDKQNDEASIIGEGNDAVLCTDNQSNEGLDDINTVTNEIDSKVLTIDNNDTNPIAPDIQIEIVKPIETNISDNSAVNTAPEEFISTVNEAPEQETLPENTCATYYVNQVLSCSSDIDSDEELRIHQAIAAHSSVELITPKTLNKINSSVDNLDSTIEQTTSQDLSNGEHSIEASNTIVDSIVSLNEAEIVETDQSTDTAQTEPQNTPANEIDHPTNLVESPEESLATSETTDPTVISESSETVDPIVISESSETTDPIVISEVPATTDHTAVVPEVSATTDPTYISESSETTETLTVLENSGINNTTTNSEISEENPTNEAPDMSDSESIASQGDNSQELHRSSSVTRRVRFSLDTDDRSNNPQGRTSSVTITEEMKNLGKFPPVWVPDMDAKNCMNCDFKFTVVKRRHHCRACGKVLCSQCCNMKFNLPYINYKLARVCQTCCDTMVTVITGDHSNDASLLNQLQQLIPTTTPQSILTTSTQAASSTTSTLPEAPPPYSETIDGPIQRISSISSNAPPYTESPHFSEQPAPIITAGQALDILPSTRSPGFPGSPVNEMVNFQPLNSILPSYSASGVRPRPSRSRTESEMSAVIMFNSTATNLPPILRRSNEETRIINNPDLTTLFMQMNDENEDPVSFIVNKNLVVRVKVINMDCCVEKKCWCFVSDGMGASNQEEVVILIKCDSSDIEEAILTRKVLTQMNAIFEKAKHGHPVSDLEHMEFESSMMCQPKNVAMLFFKLTLQCPKKLLLPTSPYLFGLYIESSEVPWAKNFPLRLLLRIGAEFKYYPCPLFNVLDRPPVYQGVRRTILDLLADFQNFQYTIPRVNGVTINLRGKDTIIKLPQHRYDEVMKAVNSSEDNVLSLAGNFSSTCDGHLVSVEKDGRYKTQTLSIVMKENRKVTCASFIVISAALKPGPEGIKAKASIVEDGVMVQVTADIIKEIKTAIKDMKEYTVTAGDPASPDATSQVGIEWTAAEVSDRPRLLSPIDGTSFDNLTNMKIRHSYDYTSNSLTAKIHWVEVYFLPQDNDTVQRLSARELGQMTSSIAKACMSALSPHLMTLIALEMLRIGLRVNLASDFVEYKIGANLTSLPAELLPTLDDKLVPAIHSVMSNAQERVAVELIFQVVKIV